ncbi:MAG: D-TA family PLP-dependent enzyme [Alphaproteobacteria bacterium]|nr:D-TA family PLP-dependent enzyme [Alphaproteobacteria bacterium]
MALTLNDIETPAFVVNEERVLRNISKFQNHCDARGLKLRPHIKTHKSIRFAKAQIEAGAVGINCQKIGEAEIMADAGLNDILITFNILGAPKLARLRALAERVTVRVVADNPVVVSGLSDAFANAPNPLGVLVECDTGAARCGVQSPAEAIELAGLIHQSPGLAFAGLLTYPAVGGQADVVTFMRETRDGLSASDIACPTISSGGSPDMWQAETGGVITEYRAGTYVYNDRSLVERGTCTWDDCAGHVLATVVSRPTRTRAVIDAGSKALTSDLLGLDGHGHVIGHSGSRIVGLSEEHGVMELPEDSALAIGDRIHIVPNHVCVVANMFDQAWLQTAAGDIVRLTTDARGRVT